MDQKVDDWKTRAELAEHKSRELARELLNCTEELRTARAQLAIVKADVEDVWFWQGDGYDHPESLSCPVVMSADTLRSIIRRTLITEE